MLIIVFICLIIIFVLVDIVVTRVFKGRIKLSLLRSIFIYPFVAILIAYCCDLKASRPHVYIHDGKYGFKTKFNILHSAEYSSIDTMPGIFSYQFSYRPRGNKIDIYCKEIYLAKDSLYRVDIYVKQYKRDGPKEFLLYLINDCDSVNIFHDKVNYSLPNLPQTGTFPLDRIVYYKGGYIDTIFVNGSDERPKLIRCPWYRFQSAIFVNTDPF